jgi:hypothetical protein
MRPELSAETEPWVVAELEANRRRAEARMARWLKESWECPTEADLVRYTRLVLFRDPTRAERKAWRDHAAKPTEGSLPQRPQAPSSSSQPRRRAPR